VLAESDADLTLGSHRSPYADGMAWSLDSRLTDFVRVTEVDDGAFFVADLFRRKFGHVVPGFGHHVVAFVRQGEAFRAASYLHLWIQDAIGLIGGGCTDGRALREMPADQAAAIEASGGLLLHTLGYTFDRFEDRLEAYFGHCGDARAKAVDLRAGFRETEHPHILVRYNRTMTDARKRELFAQAVRIGDF
jgi:hypothetical protein